MLFFADVFADVRACVCAICMDGCYCCSLYPALLFQLIYYVCVCVCVCINVQEAQLSPSDRAMRLVSSNLANYHATVQKILIRQVLTKPMV